MATALAVAGSSMRKPCSYCKGSGTVGPLGRPKVLSESIKQAAIALRLNGKMIREIAAELYISIGSAHRAVGKSRAKSDM